MYCGQTKQMMAIGGERKLVRSQYCNPHFAAPKRQSLTDGHLQEEEEQQEHGVRLQQEGVLPQSAQTTEETHQKDDHPG